MISMPSYRHANLDVRRIGVHIHQVGRYPGAALQLDQRGNVRDPSRKAGIGPRCTMAKAYNVPCPLLWTQSVSLEKHSGHMSRG